MQTRVICVSRAMGAGGEDVAHGLSQRMQFRYVDEEIVAKAAERDKVDVHLVKDAERRQTFMERLLESFAVAPGADVMSASQGFLYSAAFDTGTDLVGGAVAFSGTEHFRELIRDVVRDTARQGNVIIVAHAAAMALAGQPGVLRVLVTASRDVRIQRVAASGLSPEDAAQAIAESDKGRADYLKTFYDIDEERPTHYDLVINTDALSVDDAVNAVVAAATAPR